MLSTLEFFNRKSKTFLLVLAYTLVLVISVIDYSTGPELSLSIFYLIPISLLAWFLGRRAGILISIVSAILWFTADMMNGHAYLHPTIPYWNAAVRLGFFLIVTYALSALRSAEHWRNELNQFIVHDLRSPLANVMTGLYLLQEQASDTLNSEQNTLVEMGISSCDRMLTLINSLLDLARLEHGQVPLQLSQVSVGEIVETALKQVAAWAIRNKVKLISQVDAGVRVYSDPTLTVRILVNLLSNAIKFSHPGSAVTVQAIPSVDKVVFNIIDQAGGIPKEWVEKIFDKFVQIEAGTRKGVIGSGLGLSFCRYAVEAQGGRIWIESEINQGTVVSFTLPLGGV